MGRTPTAARRPGPPKLDRLAQRVAGLLPEPVGEDPTEIAYAEASARRLAARRAGEALEELARLPSIERSAVEGARGAFERREREATASLAGLEREVGSELERELHRRQAEALGRIAATDALRELAGVGLLPETMVHRAAQGVAAEVGGSSDRR